MQVLQMEDKNRKKEITRAILEALPEWFGIERAREEYIKSSAENLFWAAFDGEKLVTKLKESGINAAVIGRVTDKGRYVTKNNKRVELIPQEKDEIYKVKL